MWVNIYFIRSLCKTISLSLCFQQNSFSLLVKIIPTVLMGFEALEYISVHEDKGVVFSLQVESGVQPLGSLRDLDAIRM